MRISDWSSDVCSSDLRGLGRREGPHPGAAAGAGRGPFLESTDEARDAGSVRKRGQARRRAVPVPAGQPGIGAGDVPGARAAAAGPTAGQGGRSEEHTSELQSLMRISYAVFGWTKKNNSQLSRR